MKFQKNINFSARIFFLLIVLFCGKISVKAQDVDYKAYTLFVYNFMKYVEWPAEQSKGDFIIGVLGDSPIQKELSGLASTKKIKGRTIVVKKITTPEEGKDCHMVYVASGKSSLIKTLREITKERPVLIVGEREGLAKKGAELSFVTLDDDELKFDISNKEILGHKLKISDQLIQLGIVVD